MSGGAPPCEPISWLRLERYHLGELSHAEHEIVAGHLATCDRCRSCLNRIQSPEEERDLRPLPLEVGSATVVPATADGAPLGLRGRRARRAWSARWSGLTLGTVGAAAALALMVARWPEAPISHGHRIQAKGGDVTFELVRERNGSVAYDPGSFSASDRLKVFLTCPPPARLYADIAILQDDGVAFPFEPIVISCGNRIAIPPAFRITGRGPAVVCVAVDHAGPPPRHRLRSAISTGTPLDAQSTCVRLSRADD